MKASTLIEELQNVIDHEGDIDILLQMDAEGNGYDWIRGAGVCYVTEDLESR